MAHTFVAGTGELQDISFSCPPGSDALQNTSSQQEQKYDPIGQNNNYHQHNPPSESSNLYHQQHFNNSNNHQHVIVEFFRIQSPFLGQT